MGGPRLLETLSTVPHTGQLKFQHSVVSILEAKRLEIEVYRASVREAQLQPPSGLPAAAGVLGLHTMLSP